MRSLQETSQSRETPPYQGHLSDTKGGKFGGEVKDITILEGPWIPENKPLKVYEATKLISPHRKVMEDRDKRSLVPGGTDKPFPDSPANWPSRALKRAWQTRP